MRAVLIVSLLLIAIPIAGASLPPAPPTDLTADQSSSTGVNLSWTASADASTTTVTYNIYRDGNLLASQSGTTYSDTLTDAAALYYVTTVEGTTESVPSQPIIVSPTACHLIYVVTTYSTTTQGLAYGGCRVNLTRLGLVPAECPPVGIDVKPAYPFVAVVVYDECIPLQ